MASCWLKTLLGIALLQGILAGSLGDLDQRSVDDEWKAFQIQTRDVAYRLPTTTSPSHYAFTITPYFDDPPTGVDPFTFDGEVTIYLSATQANVNQIVMHCEDLNITTVSLTTLVNGVEQDVATDGVIPTCEMPYAFLTVNPTAALIQDQEYILRMTYTGNLQTDMRGFYRSFYYDGTGRRWMGTTQFQPGHARKAFPCYDEPGFKATFDITIVRESTFSPTISNMPIANTTVLTNGRTSETFYTTPVTSTYLLAFIVSHYAAVSTNNDTVRPFEIYARDNAGSTGDWALEVGEQLLEAMELYTNISYYEMAPNMNMKQAAIPDFSAGAMENWGLLTYREALILYDPLNSNHFYRQRIANIVAHEIAHMWFGNLVTCAWWENLWLNEAFARFYQYFLTGSVVPELGFETRFIVEQFQSAAMATDSVDSAHALTNPAVNDPTTVSAHFSSITYAKGACLLRMTQHLLGEETYVAGLRSYLSDRSYDVAEPEHLFEALDAAAAASGALAPYPADFTIEEYFQTWSLQSGHPLLTVTVDHSTGLMTVVQARWERDTGSSAFPNLYQIPITWTRGGNPDFADVKPSQILFDQVTVIDRGSTGYEWVIFNKQSIGFFRINYDSNTWALITRALRGAERTTIHEYNRAQIVEDVFALARSGTITYTRALNILSFLEFEDAYAPWISAITGFNWVLRRVAHDAENLQLLQNEIIRLSAAITARLGYAEVDGETYMDGLLRMYVMTFLCSIGHSQCVSAAVTNFQNWRNGTFIPANMRPWVYCEGLRAGDAEDFNALWTHFTQEELAGEIVVLLEQLGCTSDTASLHSYLDQIVADNDYVRDQDQSSAYYYAIYKNEENTMKAFEWLQNNTEQAAGTFVGLATPISYIAARLLTEEQITEFETWLAANQAELGTAYNTGVSGAASARSMLQWSSQRIPELEQYFTEGYVDFFVDPDVTEETTTTTTTTTTTEASIVTEAPDSSASIAALSVATLVVSLAVKML